MRSVALILAKGKSKRLKNKNKLKFKGEPMFVKNLRKCITIFDEVYVSSDDMEILHLAKYHGAIPISRGEELCGDTPNIPVYQHALWVMPDIDFLVAVQANSPTIDKNIIANVKHIMELGANEVMTCDENYDIYGSVWAMTKDRLENYLDPYNPQPDILIVDKSTDIHTQEDFIIAYG